MNAQAVGGGRETVSSATSGAATSPEQGCDAPLLVVAGEASGDQHAARLLSELRKLRPELQAFGLGSDQLRTAGLETLADSSEISVVGIAEVLKILPRAREIFGLLLAACEERGVRTAVLVDFPDFNLRLARQLHRRGIRVVYYISPQVWAWRRRRVKQIAKTVHRMLVLFDFEREFYLQHGVDAAHVGHPLVDEIPAPEVQAWDRERNGEPFQVALLPGSRRSEVAALLPTMLESVQRLSRALPVRPVLIQAPSVPEQLFDRALADAQLPVERVREQRFARLAQCHLALCASGTATLEVGLLGTPMMVLYRLKTSTYWLARMLVRLPAFSLVNLVLGHAAVPERLQADARPERVASEAAKLLSDPEAIARQRASLAELRPHLGRGGASRRAAEEVLRVLKARA